MNYVSITVWKHEKSIDWNKMQAMLTENIKNPDLPKGCWIKWFDIDETTHGSIFAYPSLEAFEEHTEKREAHRKESSENLGITLIHKHDGLVKAEASN